jgi:hypothetical protein
MIALVALAAAAFMMFVVPNQPDTYMWIVGAIWTPPVIAGLRHHHNRLAIFMASAVIVALLMAGVSVAHTGGFVVAFAVALPVWLVALIWSCTAIRKEVRS